MRTPTVIVLALLTMQPRLEADESILAMTRTAMGSGKLKSDAAKGIADQWASAANAGRRDDKKIDPGKLAAIGFIVRRVKVKKKAKK